MKSRIERRFAPAKVLPSMGIFCLLVVFVAGCTQWTEEQKKRQSLPDFHFEAWDGGVLQRSDLKEDQPMTMFYYDPDCEHCQGTLSSMSAKIDEFGNNTLVIITSGGRDKFLAKLIRLHLLKHPNVRVGFCEPQEFLDTFGTTQTPTALFYGADWDLKRAYKGAMSQRMVTEGLKAAAEE